MENLDKENKDTKNSDKNGQDNKVLEINENDQQKDLVKKVQENTINIIINNLEKNNYTFNKGKEYKYINVGDLKIEMRRELIKVLGELNHMPKNFLEFVFITYLDYLNEIFKDNVVNSDILSDYNQNKFGLRIKIDKSKEKD